MTDATTAEVLAAWQLIDVYDIEVKHGRDGAVVCESRSGRRGVGSSRIAAVRAWAEAAGVPWPKAKVVPMLAVMDGRVGVQMVAQSCDEGMARRLYGDRIVPCEVVIKTETEATP